LIDLALWLSPLDGENPSGEDLRNDQRFHEIERLIEPQTKVSYDDRNRPVDEVTIPADWANVLAKTEELRSHGRDLRLLLIVTRALANEEGLAGLAQGLLLVAQTIDQHWETMHPSLRRNAPPRDAALRRINALADLQNAQNGVLGDLRRKVLLAPRAVGPINGRELEQAALDDRTMLQEAASGLNAKEQAALVEAHGQLILRVRAGCAAYADQSAGEMSALTDSARDALAALDQLDVALNAKLESTGQNVPILKRFLERTLATLERAQAAEAPLTKSDEPVATPLSNGHAPGAVMAATGPSVGLPDKINSRDEVVKCLDLVVAFYDRTEPSSPIPHLARRVRKMVHMDFVELMEDLAPSGLKEFRLLAGIPDGKKAPQKDERS
jgi:type VI secretion system protein ImpA